MRIPSWLLVAAAVVAALPFGWGLGVLAAYLLLGREIGVFPVLTIPVAVIGSIIIALSSRFSPATRLAVTAGGTVVLSIIGFLALETITPAADHYRSAAPGR
jgi:hypothetical protein